MKEILKTTESYQVEKWIGKSGRETYAIIFFNEMRYLNGKFNKNFIEKPDHMRNRESYNHMIKLKNIYKI